MVVAKYPVWNTHDDRCQCNTVLSGYCTFLAHAKSTCSALSHVVRFLASYALLKCPLPMKELCVSPSSPDDSATDPS